MKQPREDLELIRSILFNQNKILSEKTLYNKYFKVVYNKVRRYKYDTETAEDISTDIMLKVFGSLEKYNHTKCSFNTWVMRITSNHLIDLYRKSKNAITFISYSSTATSNSMNYENNSTTLSGNYTSTYNPIYSNMGNSYTQEDSYICKENYQNAINTLTTAESKILQLKYEFGYTNSEIGTMYDVSKTVVSNKINYLKKKILKKNDIF